MSNAAHEEPVDVDVNRVRDVAAGCGWTVAELTEFYEPRARAEIVGIREALAAGDIGSVARLTHGAAGSSSTIGMESMASRYRLIFEDASQSPVPRLREMVEDVERHLERVLVRLAELVGSES